MYMRNNRSKYSKYNIPDFPPNYSGQYTKDSVIRETEDISERNSGGGDEAGKSVGERGNFENERSEKLEKLDKPEKKEVAEIKEAKEVREAKKENPHSLIGGLFKGGKDGGILSKLFGDKGEKGGGLLSSIELEDLILLAVIFFLLKDGVEDDFLIILALILLA